MDFAAYDFWVKPVGLLSLGGILRDSGCEVSLLDCMDRHHPALSGCLQKPSSPDGTGRFYKEIIKKPESLKNVPRRYGRYGLPLDLVRRELSAAPRPDCVLVTSGMTYWYPGVALMISLLKEHFPSVPVILGGIYATLCEEHARRESGADFIVAGEGERNAIETISSLTGFSADPARYQNADGYPFPPYDLYPNLRSAVLLTSRGCPFRCPFCASHLLSGGFFKRNPAHVVREIETLARTRGVRDFAFYDDALLHQKETHLIPLLERLEEKSLSVRFHTPNGLHPAWIDSRLAGLMKRTGFQTLRLSYETADPERQKRMGGKVSNEALESAVRYLVEAGFERSSLGAYVIMGLPDQTLDETLDSLVFVFSLGIRISLASFSPIPGTESWKDAVKAGILKPDADPLLSNNSAFQMLSRPSEYHRFVKLGTLSAIGNGMLKNGKLPLEDDGFRRALDGLRD
jgi:radical SAM superfamily enzyme YgiQ (UPF0313 family)